MRAAITIAAVTALAAACGSDDDPAADPSTPVTGEGAGAATLDVVASFYPLQFVAERVAGGVATVTNLTPVGAEPHDLELSGQDTARLQDADLIVYLSRFSPALDEAVEVVGGEHSFDVAESARLDLVGAEDDHADDEDDHADDTTTSDHADEGDHADDEDHDHGSVDPHFWLDPTRLADVADAVAVRLGEIDPDRAAAFTENAATLRDELEALDSELAAGLAECAIDEIVTSHAAFGYLADRYDLEQVGISGLSPEEEPSPAGLAEVADFVTEHDVTTIYYETLADPAVAESVAAETGAEAAVLDPIEGLTDESAGRDYFEVMRSNLETLRSGQGCA